MKTFVVCGCLQKNIFVFLAQTRGELNGGTWLGFERLTCVPIQTRMVKESMLTKEEKTWLKVSRLSLLIPIS